MYQHRHAIADASANGRRVHQQRCTAGVVDRVDDDVAGTQTACRYKRLSRHTDAGHPHRRGVDDERTLGDVLGSTDATPSIGEGNRVLSSLYRAIDNRYRTSAVSSERIYDRQRSSPGAQDRAVGALDIKGELASDGRNEAIGRVTFTVLMPHSATTAALWGIVTDSPLMPSERMPATASGARPSATGKATYVQSKPICR